MSSELFCFSKKFENLLQQKQIIIRVKETFYV